MRLVGERPEGSKSPEQFTESDELKKLSHEARKMRARVEAGKAAQAELERMEQQKDMLRRTLRDHLKALQESLGQEGDVFEKMSAETARLLELYKKRADEGDRADQAFTASIEDYLRDLQASREAEGRLRGQA